MEESIKNLHGQLSLAKGQTYLVLIHQSPLVAVAWKIVTPILLLLLMLLILLLHYFVLQLVY